MALTDLEKELIVLLVLMCIATLWLSGIMQEKLCYAYLEPIIKEYCTSAMDSVINGTPVLAGMIR